MLLSQLSPLPEYFDIYILKCDDVELLDAIKISINELENAPLEKWKQLGDKTYAPGKWTVKEILQHLIDTERIFCYRALTYARGEKNTVLSFEEDDYAKASEANNRTLESLVDELMSAHLSALTLFQSFTQSMLQKMCTGFKGKYSVASVGFILPGHQRWHFEILEERYYGLI